MVMGIGGMLAQTGSNIGQQIGGTYSDLGQTFGGMLSGIGDKRRSREEQERARKLLEKHKNNPQQLNSISRNYGIQGNDALAKVFRDAAQAASQAQQEKAKQGAQAGLVGMQQLLSDPTLSPEDRAAMVRDATGSLVQGGVTAGQITSAIDAADKIRQNEMAVAQARDRVVQQAESLNMPELAKIARKTSDLSLLNSLSEKLSEKQIEDAPVMSKAARLRMLQNVGYTNKEAASIVAREPGKEEFNKYVNLQKGDVEMYLDKNGKPVTYRTTEYGMVAVDGKLVDPSSLGLREAPNQQIVENVSSTMSENIAKLGAENFNELYGQATKSEESIRSIDNIIGDVDTMFSGSLANVALQVNKFMKSAGIPANDLAIENTEVFIAESAKRVADYITNLGAGTGLSDKDLEFTRKVVAGDVTLDANTIQRMLKEFRQASERKINNYMKTRSKIEGRLKQNEEGALDFYLPITVPQPSALSENAQKYLR